MYNPFHKILPKSSLQMHWISVRFYEMGNMYGNEIKYTYQLFFSFVWIKGGPIFFPLNFYMILY